jgi:hypothetical protein
MADYATLLRDHVTLTCRSVDRIFLQAYVPRYQLTGTGRALAVLFTKAYGRILGPGLATLDPKLPPAVATRSGCPQPARPRLEGPVTRTRPFHRSRAGPSLNTET